jgi:ADP-heptose:LPS heptosyltransferase
VSGLKNISNILAIRFARVGDIVLLLPALVHLKGAFPGAKLTLLTGRPCAPVASLCPYVDDVISVDRLRMRDGSRIEALREMIRLVRDLRERDFDLAVDFHSFRETNLLAWLSGASYRLGMKRSDRAYLPFCFNLEPALEDKSVHVAEMFRRVAESIPGVGGNSFPTFPVITAPQEVDMAALSWDTPGPVIALFVGASVSERRWPASRFAVLASMLAREWGASVVILSGASVEEERLAREVERQAGLGHRARLLAGLSILQLAQAITGADALVSNDSGPMHLGSALGVPTLGIFSSSLPEHYRPMGSRDRYIQKDSIEEVQVAEVLAILKEMGATEPRNRRLGSSGI